MNKSRTLILVMQVKRKLSVILSIIVMFVMTGEQSFAQQPAPRKIGEGELQELLKVKTRTVQHLALNPTLVKGVLSQNSKNLTLDEIKKRDQAWKSTKKPTPFKLSLQSNSPGRLIKKYVTKNTAFNEGFLTDNQGANVAAFPATSDYWQGDEEKWIASYNSGNGKIFISPVKFDESSNTYAAQISAPVFHRGKTIGVLVVGVTISYLDAKRK